VIIVCFSGSISGLHILPLRFFYCVRNQDADSYFPFIAHEYKSGHVIYCVYLSQSMTHFTDMISYTHNHRYNNISQETVIMQQTNRKTVRT